MARSLYLTAPHYTAPDVPNIANQRLETGEGPQPTSYKQQASSDKQQALDIVLYIGYYRMITKLMEDTCLKDMQATKLSLRKIVKNLQVHPLPKALRSMGWTLSSSGIHCSTLPSSSSSKIFRILTSTGASALTSILRPSSSRRKRATSVQSADTRGFRMTKFPALFANNITPAARIAWLAASPGSKPQASSYKLRNFSYMDSSDKQQASSFKPQATSCKISFPS